MEEKKPDLKLLSNWIDKIHNALSNLRRGLVDLDDAAALALFIELELATLSRMLMLRKSLGIPYDWHEKK